MKTGYTDLPARIDAFNIERYISGLTEFIKTCTTPITMAIQGDWGTGKTSIMSMIKESLEKETQDTISIVWFNTWQFSQFNMGDKLPLLMMSKLVNAVCDKDDSKFKENAEKIITTLGNVLLGYVSGGSANMDSMKSSEKLTDIVDQIDGLRNNFQRMVDQKAGDKGRVVIFIDDLDRLNPGKAVELLEVLKVFLDCEKCVFVLAIDYGVVSRGVKEKYGDDFSEEKGKSFFDKIIQVPFKMPVADYDISNYVRNSFQEMGISIDDDRLLESYVCLINDSIGNNPRSMKRLFNSYLLLSKIAVEKLFEDMHNKEILFALLCMQSKYEKVYDYLIKQKDKVSFEELNSWKDSTDGAIYKLVAPEGDDYELFKKFMENFIDIIDSNGDRKVDADEMARFQEVLSFSAITANNVVNTESSDGEYRWRHKDKARKIIQILDKDFPDTHLDDWHTRTHDKASWWGYTKKNYVTSDGLEYAWEFRFDPVGNTGKLMSTMTINLFHRGGKNHDIREVLEEIGQNPFEFLSVKPVIENNGYRISYRDVLQFDTESDEKDELIIETLKKTLGILCR